MASSVVVVENWRLKSGCNGQVTLCAWFRSEIPSKLKDCVTGDSSLGSYFNGQKSKPAVSYEVNISLPAKDIAKHPTIDAYQVTYKGLRLVMGFGNRAGNPTYPRQELEEIAHILEG
jgi:hypothetical protein